MDGEIYSERNVILIDATSYRLLFLCNLYSLHKTGFRSYYLLVRVRNPSIRQPLVKCTVKDLHLFQCYCLCEPINDSWPLLSNFWPIRASLPLVRGIHLTCQSGVSNAKKETFSLPCSRIGATAALRAAGGFSLKQWVWVTERRKVRRNARAMRRAIKQVYAPWSPCGRGRGGSDRAVWFNDVTGNNNLTHTHTHTHRHIGCD